jgi:hypothetical protein
LCILGYNLIKLHSCKHPHASTPSQEGQFTILTSKSRIQESLASSSSKSEYKKKLQKALYEISSYDEDEFANENPDYGPNLLSAHTHIYIRIF